MLWDLVSVSSSPKFVFLLAVTQWQDSAWNSPQRFRMVHNMLKPLSGSSSATHMHCLSLGCRCESPMTQIYVMLWWNYLIFGRFGSLVCHVLHVILYMDEWTNYVENPLRPDYCNFWWCENHPQLLSEQQQHCRAAMSPEKFRRTWTMFLISLMRISC